MKTSLAIVMTATLISFTSTAPAAIVLFEDDFESPVVTDFSVSAPSGWIKATAGPFGANRSGIWNDTYEVGDGSTTLEGNNSSLSTGASYSTPDGDQAYLLTYYNANNGITTAEGAIGEVGLGDYTVSFLQGMPTNVVDGQFNNAVGDVTVTLYAMDGVTNASRNNITTTPTGATVLVSQVISSSATTLESKSLVFTQENAALVGQDFAIRFQADSFDFPLVDDVSVSFVVIPEPASLALMGIGALLIAGRRRKA